MKALASVLLGSLLVAAAAHADGSALLREELVDNLTFMKGVYRAEYAMQNWKKTYAGWDLDTQFNLAIATAQSTPNLTVTGAHDIIKSFIYSMKDYHVSVSFQSSEAATLPFTVKGTAAGRYFLAYIDRAKLTEDAFPFSVGDELVSFDGVPTAQAVASVQAEIPANIPETDRQRAELALTSRGGVKGYKIPQGPVTLAIRPQGSQSVREIQLIWDYTPEKVKDPFGVMEPVGTLMSSKSSLQSAPTSKLLHPVMAIDADALPVGSDNPYLLGARKSFMPALGTKIWESDPKAIFHAYMYKTADRRLIGYVRISSYSPDDSGKAEAEFGKLVSMFETATDALVIDQVDNPGGSVFYLYTLASMLTDKPLVAPRHRMALTQADIVDAYKQLATLDKVTNDEQAKDALGSSLDGYPATYETAQFTKNYLRYLIAEFNAGRTLTNPYWLQGADHINPAATHYTKPILLVINNLDFSGGDFFPATMQDNKRVTVFGSRTAGAGGYVNDVNFPNDLGVNAFRVTESIAERVDKNPIENLGVKPDIAYDISEADLTGGYADYVKAINAAVLGLIK